MLLTALEDSRSYPGWREGAQALLQGTGHLQTDLGQVMAGGTKVILQGGVRTEQPGLSAKTQTFQEHHSCSAAGYQTPVNPGGRAAECWLIPTQYPLVPLGRGKGLSSHLKDISIDSGSSILETS